MSDPSARPVATVPSVRVTVIADRCPQVALRVIGLLAQQSIIPLTFSLRRRSRTLVMEVAVDGIDARATAILLNKIAAIVAVRSVRRLRQ